MFESTSLRDDHVIDEFDCGIPPLNVWLHREARRAQQKDTTRTYVWTGAGSRSVVAYYSIAPTAVFRQDLSKTQAASYSYDIPGYLLGKLALDQTLHGQGLGRELLVDAVAKMVGAAEAYGGRLIVVDAHDDKAFAFYQKHDFQPVKLTARRLVLKISTARALLTSPGD